MNYYDIGDKGLVPVTLRHIDPLERSRIQSFTFGTARAHLLAGQG